MIKIKQIFCLILPTTQYYHYFTTTIYGEFVEKNKLLGYGNIDRKCQFVTNMAVALSPDQELVSNFQIKINYTLSLYIYYAVASSDNSIKPCNNNTIHHFDIQQKARALKLASFTMSSMFVLISQCLIILKYVLCRYFALYMNLLVLYEDNLKIGHCGWFIL